MSYLDDPGFKNRFWSKVDRPEDLNRIPCWEWTASTRKSGYGQVWCGDTCESSHKIAFELEFGPLAEGKVLRHTCDNPLCCNPHHLVPGDQAANMRDMVQRGRNRFQNSRSKSGREISL